MNSNDWENAYKSMIYRVSHDLDAPLRHINSFAQLIDEKHTEFDDETKSWLEHVHTASSLSRRMLKDLLRLSRIHSQPSRKEPIDVKVLADAIGASIKQKLPVATCDINLEQLQIVLDELESNCKKYGEFAGLEMHCSNNAAILTVCDLGTGINNVDWSVAIQPFQRLGYRCDEENNGVGLSIANAIIVEHEGLLTNSSRGVVIELPCTIASLD